VNRGIAEMTWDALETECSRIEKELRKYFT